MEDFSNALRHAIAAQLQRRVVSKPKTVHWGDWVIARSRMLGFKRKQDFARAVGCSDNQVTRWASMGLPPDTMRKGFDVSLAKTLETTREILFIGYRVSPPEQTPTFTGLKGLAVDHLMIDLTDVLLPSEREKIAQYAITLMMAKNDGRRRDAAHLVKHYGLEFLFNDLSLFEEPKGK